MMKEFIEKVKNNVIDLQRVEQIENVYKVSLPELAKHIISFKEKDIFFDDYRILSYEEILAANEELHVPFTEERIIPFIDCMDNDFIVYDIDNKSWTKYNIVEKIKFGKIADLEEERCIWAITPASSKKKL